MTGAAAPPDAPNVPNAPNVPDAPPRARLRALRAALHEAPLALGIAAGLAITVHLGRAYLLDHKLEGYRWPDYVYTAWMVHAGRPEHYDSFRNPLHGALVSGLGEAIGSYADAAVIVSSVAVTAMIVGAALGARALANPLAGGLAAVTLPMCLPVADAARWANLYPLLGGTTSLAVGLAAVAARWPHPVTAALAGSGMALAWGTDARALPFLGVVVPLVLLGAWRAARPGGPR
ncbi:MAG: hypothetical protein Q8P41_07710, partial [Pseudomonadota bacterium]|nr:hypothetical protein [Pseudomonadota bacterium]